MFEFILIEEREVMAHLLLIIGPALPHAIVEDNLSWSAWSQVALIPIHKRLPQSLVIQLGTDRPSAISNGHVGSREGTEESTLGHRKAAFPCQDEELESDPSSDRVGPNNVRDSVVQFFPHNGK